MADPMIEAENYLVHIWKEAAEREARQSLTRFIIICVALLSLLGAIRTPA